MPFDAPAPAHTSWSQIEAAAMAYAARLDVLLAETENDALEDALLAVGELLGGLGYKGFSADLRAHLERVEADLLSDADPWDYSSGRGGNDPDAIFSARLSDEIDVARADDAADWLASAQALLEASREAAPEAA